MSLVPDLRGWTRTLDHYWTDTSNFEPAVNRQPGFRRGTRRAEPLVANKLQKDAQRTKDYRIKPHTQQKNYKKNVQETANAKI